jgi:hypothetical protein
MMNCILLLRRLLSTAFSKRRYYLLNFAGNVVMHLNTFSCNVIIGERDVSW